MNDWADHINLQRMRESENWRMEEMERRVAPIMWLMVVVVFCFVVWAAYSHYKVSADLAHLQREWSTATRGGIVGVGKDRVMSCQVRKIMREEL